MLVVVYHRKVETMCTTDRALLDLMNVSIKPGIFARKLGLRKRKY